VAVGTQKSSEEMVKYWQELLGRYPSVIAIVDPMRKQVALSYNSNMPLVLWWFHSQIFFENYHHHHHHQRISSRCKACKTPGPLSWILECIGMVFYE